MKRASGLYASIAHNLQLHSRILHPRPRLYSILSSSNLKVTQIATQKPYQQTPWTISQTKPTSSNQSIPTCSHSLCRCLFSHYSTTTIAATMSAASLESKLPSPQPAVANTSSSKNDASTSTSQTQSVTTTTGLTQSSDTTQCLMTNLWRDYLEHSIEYRQYFSNHLAHSLIALHEMGASKQRIQEMFESYSGKLRPRFGPNSQPPNHQNEHKESSSSSSNEALPRTREELMPLVGKLSWNECVAFFERAWMELEQTLPLENDSRTIEQCLIQLYFPSFMPYAVGHATHPLIHLGWGQMLSEGKSPYWYLTTIDPSQLSKSNSASTSAGNKRQNSKMNPITIAGLAYLAYRGLRLDIFEGRSLYDDQHLIQSKDINSLSLAKVLEKTINMSKEQLFPLMEKYKEDSYFKGKFEGMFQRRIGILSELGSKQTTELALSWKIDEDEPIANKVKELQQTIILLYGISPNEFFVLHGCTSYFAFRQLLPLLLSTTSKAQQILMLRQMLHVILTVFIGQHLPIQPAEMSIATKFIQNEDPYEAMESVMKQQPEYLKHDWQFLLDEAMATNDEHTQKLVMVCWRDMLDSQKNPLGNPDNVKTWCNFLRWCSAKRIEETEDDDDE